MGEEAVDDYELHMVCYDGGGGGEDERVMEWESGLPGADELTPLSQPLVPPGLAAAFRIPPEPGRTLLDVHRASAATVSRLRRAPSSSSGSGGSGSSFAPFHPHQAAAAARGDEGADSSAAALGGGGGGAATTNTNTTTNGNSSKRPRLVWTPQLHKRFVDVVAHLGIKNAVPKTIMQLMNVEGLTRENVASHLQKYRLYVKRMQGLSNEGPSPSDHIFASTPVPHSLVHEPQPQQVPVPATMYAMHGGMLPMASGGGQAYHHYYHDGRGGGGGGGYPLPHPQAAYNHHYHHADK